MKNGTVYAGKLKKAWSKVKSGFKSDEIPEQVDPLRCLATGILGVQTTEERAERALKKILDAAVDWNEVRVSNPEELASFVGAGIPNCADHCQRLILALQDIYDNENEVGLGRLHSLGRREARHYLESLGGMDAFSVASVMLWSLGGHAIPVNDHLMDALSVSDLIDPGASRAEVQAFLERHISAADGKIFVTAMRSFKPTKTTRKKAVKKAKTGKVTKKKVAAASKTTKKKTRKKASR
ncbi:MAG: hypothetical protein ACYTHJ_11830 [Planctomycetota bacterium]|jgi:endonuclease III